MSEWVCIGRERARTSSLHASLSYTPRISYIGTGSIIRPAVRMLKITSIMFEVLDNLLSISKVM